MLQPSRILDFLGLHFNLERALISPPDSFLPTLTNVLSRLSPTTVMPARKISSIISRMSHFAPFIYNGRLHVRFLQFWFKTQWSQHQQSWDTPIQLDTDFLTYLRWFKRQNVMTGVPLHLPEPSLFFFTDASLKGWGASWKDLQISGLWSDPESPCHINWLELEAIRLALLHWGPQWRSQSVGVYWDNSTVVVYIRKQGGTHSQSLFHKTPGSVCDNSSSYTSSRSQERYGRCSVPNQSTQPNGMAHPNRNLEQSVLWLRNSPDRHVCHSGEQGHARLCFSLPGRQSMGSRHPVPILGRFGTSLCVSFGSHCPQNSPENPKISRHHGHPACVTTSILTVAPSSSTVEHTSSNPSPGRQPVPVCAQSQTPQISPRSKTIGSSCVEIIRDVLKSHHFPNTVVDMAGNPLRDSSSNVYNLHWKAFALWANNKGILPSDLSYVTLAEYLVYLFSQNKKVNTIQVHKASISGVLKLLNSPTAIQEETLHNFICRMIILWPREQEVLPKWNLSVVLKGLMKPPFAIRGTDKNVSLELLSYKTAFLVALATGARGSELVALSRASHNME